MPDRMTPERLAEIEQLDHLKHERAAAGGVLNIIGEDETNELTHEVRRCWAQMEAQGATHPSRSPTMPDRLTPERLAEIERALQDGSVGMDDAYEAAREVRRCWAQMEAQGAIVQRLTEQLRANGLEPDLRPAKK